MPVIQLNTGLELHQELQPPEVPGGGGDGGNIPPMEARLGQLEAFAEDAKSRLTRVEMKLDHIEKEVSSFKWWMLGGVLSIIITVITTVIGTGIGIQQMTVTTFEAAGKANATSTAQPIVITIPQSAIQPPAAKP